VNSHILVEGRNSIMAANVPSLWSKAEYIKYITVKVSGIFYVNSNAFDIGGSMWTIAGIWTLVRSSISVMLKVGDPRDQLLFEHIDRFEKEFENASAVTLGDKCSSLKRTASSLDQTTGMMLTKLRLTHKA